MGRMKDLAMAMADGDRYPDSPGYKESTTSRDAARAIAGDVDTIRRRVLAEIEAKPCTADEVATALGISVLTIRPRVSELRARGDVEPSGERRKNASGVSAIVWSVTL